MLKYRIYVVSLVLAATSFLSIGHANADSAAIQRAVNDPARPAADKALDERRKPAEVLAFFQIQPGTMVLDVFGGGGYYTEILSHLVGADGFVTLYNNTPWNEAVAKDVSSRLADDRLPNVDNYVADTADLINQPDQYDAAIIVLGFHDVYMTAAEINWPAIDRERFYRGVYKLLADGAVLGVVDHNAMPGSDPSVVAKALHRIDPAVIIRDLEAVGFTLEAESDILRNPKDDLTTSVFTEENRWQTDRSVLRFRK